MPALPHFRSNPAQILALEPRRLLATGDIEPLTVELDAGVLRISGTSDGEQIHVTRSRRTWTVSDARGWSTSRTTGAVRSLFIKAGAGDDLVRLDPSVNLPASIFGNSGNDTLIGGSAGDSLYGHAGNDFLHGSAGDDLLIAVGGTLRDTLTGGGGVDSFWLDSGGSERIIDLSPQENRVGGVHRVGAFESLRGRAIAKDVTGVRADLVDPVSRHKGGRWSNFASRPLFAASGPGIDDVRQGELGDCYLHAPLAATAANNPRRIRESIADLGDGTFAVQLQRDGRKLFYRIDADLPVGPAGRNTPVYAGLGLQGALWPALMEKAFAFHRTGAGTYASIDNGGWFDETFSALGTFGYRDHWLAQFDSPRDVIDRIADELESGRAVTVATSEGIDESLLVSGHAYTVARVVTSVDGRRDLLMRNPWGIDGAPADGRDDGYVTVSPEQLAAGAFAFTSAPA